MRIFLFPMRVRLSGIKKAESTGAILSGLLIKIHKNPGPAQMCGPLCCYSPSSPAGKSLPPRGRWRGEAVTEGVLRSPAQPPRKPCVPLGTPSVSLRLTAPSEREPLEAVYGTWFTRSITLPPLFEKCAEHPVGRIAGRRRDRSEPGTGSAGIRTRHEGPACRIESSS